PGVAQGLYNHMQQLLPLLIHSKAREHLPEWFEEQPSARERWGEWWELSLQYLGKLIELKVFPATWVQALLMDRDLKAYWHRSLIVDLNAELSPIEAEILNQLAEFSDVKVLVP